MPREPSPHPGQSSVQFVLGTCVITPLILILILRPLNGRPRGVESTSASAPAAPTMSHRQTKPHHLTGAASRAAAAELAGPDAFLWVVDSLFALLVALALLSMYFASVLLV